MTHAKADQDAGSTERRRGGTQLILGDEAFSSMIAEDLAGVEELLHKILRSDFDFVTEAALHLVDAGGKRIRPMFTLLAAQLGRPEREKVIKAAAVVELVHLATLYHDDVMDEATMRRGAQSANTRWSNSVAILTGDYLFAHASALVSDLGTDAARIIAETFGELVTGQMRETVGPKAGVDPIEHYLRVIAEKTGSLIATAGRYGGMFSGLSNAQITALSRYGEIIGTAFQISDDIIDIASPPEDSGKTPGTDLREGVSTLPMLHVLADGTDIRLCELLSGPITSDDLITEALKRLRASDGLARARDTLEDYADRARAVLVELPAGPARDALAHLTDYVIARTN